MGMTTLGLMLALAMQSMVHPEQVSTRVTAPPIPERNVAPLAPPQPFTVRPDGTRVKNGLVEEDYAYVMPAGVTTREVIFYSDFVPCYAKIFFPRNYDPTARIPAVVLGQGQAGTHVSIEKYGARFADRGLVAMVIDYRGWGFSEGLPFIVNPIVGGDFNRDLTRFDRRTVEVEFRRTRLDPRMQQEDYRAAISFIQGEPGVDPARIGVWGSSLAGGNAVAVAGQDARVKAVSIQIGYIGGPVEPGPATLRGANLEQAISLARTGHGAETSVGFSRRYYTDQDMAQATAENYTMYYATKIGNRPFQAVVAGNEQLFNNDASSRRALTFATGPTNYIVVPNIGHFDMYIGEPFEISANAAADWFVQHLNAPQAADPPAPSFPGRGGGAPADGRPGQ